MSKKYLPILAALTASGLATAIVRAETIDDLAKKIRDKYASYKTIQYHSVSNSNVNMPGVSMKTDSDMTIWASRKDSKTVLTRMEAKTKTVQKMGDQPESKTDSNMVSVFDGEYSWTLSEAMGTKQVIKQKPDPKNEVNPFDPITVMQKMYDMKLLKDETVNGKPCYVIEMSPKDPMMRMAVGKTVAYYDKDNLMAIKTVSYDKDGKVMATSTTDNVKFDSSIPADRFVFKAPAGVPVTDMTKSDGGMGGDKP